MELLRQVLQIVVGLGLLNVWLLRLNKNTEYRGGVAGSLKEEFAIYGLPTWFYYVIGFLKVVSGVVLILGLWLHALVFPAAILVTCLMLGAIFMHVKVSDPIKKFMPASLMLLMSLAITLL